MPAATPDAMTLPCRHLSIAVPRPAAAVYAALADPATWPRWASGLGTLRQLDDGRWVAQQPGDASSGGLMTVVFSPRNPFGILDHTVTTPAGAQIYMPMRVIANGDGAEVIITLFRQPEMDDATFARDAEWVMKDLEKLNHLLRQTNT